MPAKAIAAGQPEHDLAGIFNRRFGDFAPVIHLLTNQGDIAVLLFASFGSTSVTRRVQGDCIAGMKEGVLKDKHPLNKYVFYLLIISQSEMSIGSASKPSALPINAFRWGVPKWLSRLALLSQFS